MTAAKPPRARLRDVWETLAALATMAVVLGVTIGLIALAYGPPQP